MTIDASNLAPGSAGVRVVSTPGPGRQVPTETFYLTVFHRQQQAVPPARVV